MTFKIRIATRRSRLALRQVEIVKSYLGQEVQTETVEVITSADKILNKSLSDLGGKGLFIKELENYILNDECNSNINHYHANYSFVLNMSIKRIIIIS